MKRIKKPKIFQWGSSWLNIIFKAAGTSIDPKPEDTIQIIQDRDLFTRDGFRVLDFGAGGIFGGWVQIEERLDFCPSPHGAFYDKFCNTLGPHARSGLVVKDRG